MEQKPITLSLSDEKGRSKFDRLVNQIMNDLPREEGHAMIYLRCDLETDTFSCQFQGYGDNLENLLLAFASNGDGCEEIILNAAERIKAFRKQSPEDIN